ncbi:MAG: CpsD/CapB family tyrosine-protein kinase [Bacillota bacterium]|nr:CpsD/CapB family tyrosine-protein kinase [Bacillota bacterium]
MLSLIVKKEPKSVSAEAYRTLRTNFQFLTMGRNMKKIIITSTESGEGKTITTGNLALSLSQAGKKVLVIDCDLRKPSIHKYFELINSIGFANMVVEKLRPEEVIHKYSDNLHIITAGKTLINPAELLNVDHISPIFKGLEEGYDNILIDTPPVVSVTDAQLLAAVSDGVIMVLGSGDTNKKLCQKALQLLGNVNANILGVVLNKVTEASGGYYKNQYPYYGGEIDGKKKSKVKRESAR